MPIFSRRTVQRMLNENASFLTDDQLENLTARLNRNDLQAFDAEWEVAVLNAFSKSGHVEHEIELGGTSKLDLFFIPNKEKGSSLAADITTVSDDGFELESPVNDFYVELSKRLQNVTTGGFTLRIGSERPKKIGGLSKILLPPRGEFSKEIFNSRFKAFLKEIEKMPNKRHYFDVRTEKTSIYLSYNPGRRVFSSGWPTYRVAVAKHKNPVFNALKTKRRQLKKSGYLGPKGIIVCDGGSNMFTAPRHGAFHFFFNAEDAIADFLRQNQSIDFVLLLSSEWTSKTSPFDEGPTRRVHVRVFGNRNYKSLSLELRNCLEHLEASFPEPSNTAGGARDTIKLGFDPKALRPMASGLEVSATEISVFSSTVLALLAGVISHDDFEKALGFRSTEHSPAALRNSFAYMIEKKMRISEVEVKDTQHDDSWLVFKFDGPDPAIADFVCPNSRIGVER